jgi:hypothetical protein
VRVWYERTLVLGAHHQRTRGTGTSGEDQGHSGLANTQEHHRVEGILWVVQLLQAVRKGFSQLGAPLTDLTKKGAFQWTEESQHTFERMKEVMSTCHVLALPDFSQPFVLECDASGVGLEQF